MARQHELDRSRTSKTPDAHGDALQIQQPCRHQPSILHLVELQRTKVRIPSVAQEQIVSFSVWHDPDDVAFVWFEAHLPGVYPLFEGGKVLLEWGLVLVVLNASVDKALICGVWHCSVGLHQVDWMQVMP